MTRGWSQTTDHRPPTPDHRPLTTGGHVMNAETISLAAVYTGWDAYQQQLSTVVRPLTAEQLALRGAPELRSIYMLAAHIIGARGRWTAEVLGLGGPDVAALGGWD